jgi:type VI secretion system protein ImpG
MDPRLLRYYDRELSFVREMGEEFAREFPKIAGRLGLEGFDCADPYVERLLEAFAFIAARIHLKIDAEFPAFTSHLLEMVYPHCVAPTPSIAVVELRPSLGQGSLDSGYVVPRGTVLRGGLVPGAQTPCEFRTAHEVTLRPLEWQTFLRQSGRGRHRPKRDSVFGCAQRQAGASRSSAWTTSRSF